MSTDSRDIDDSGEISLVDGSIHYSSKTFGNWTLPVSSLRVVGEYTNDQGPYLDDYFLVFVTRTSGEWHEASVYAKGRDEFLRRLDSALPGSAELGLNNSTNWKSRVLWPKDLGDRPLFEISRREHGDGLWRKLVAILDGRLNIRIADDVLRFIRDNP